MIQSDRELLEMAAKAAGIEIEIKFAVTGAMYAWRPNPVWNSWEPITDDGDALRLAVQLGILGDIYVCGDKVVFREDFTIHFWEHGDDRISAVRRAIVRAAAEIGLSMP